ncbi:MAG: hypothetical protein Fur0022_46760 [Anaerolineales bacterium]
MKHAWKTRFAKFLTLRWRLTFWMTGLLVVLGMGLIILINTLTSTRFPEVVSVVLEPTGVPLEPLDPTILLTPSLIQEPPFPADVGKISVIDQVQEIILREVRLISLIGVGIFALVGAIGAYWIAQQALNPVQHLNQLAQEIQAETLDRRLALDGPSDELKELADTFDIMLERLERAFEQQGRFVADAAHELRTPLAALRTNLEVIQHDPNATLSDYRDMSAALNRALHRLESLVEDMLLLARGEKEIQLERLNLEVLLAEVIEELRPLAQTCQVSLKLHIADDLEVRADAPVLTRAVRNLVENGIRYNEPNGSVVVTVYRENDGVGISVEDIGIGISEEDLSHIFERFYRVDPSRSRYQGGSGLGLSITQHIIQLHGGHLRAESQPGTGSVFTIWLPGMPGNVPPLQT